MSDNKKVTCPFKYNWVNLNDGKGYVRCKLMIDTEVGIFECVGEDKCPIIKKTS